MLMANCCVSLQYRWSRYMAQLEVYAVSRCVLFNGDFTFFSFCQLVVLGMIETAYTGCCWSAVKQQFTYLLTAG